MLELHNYLYTSINTCKSVYSYTSCSRLAVSHGTYKHQGFYVQRHPIKTSQKQSPGGVLQKQVLPKISHNSQEKTCVRVSLVWHRCFPVTFVKYLRTPFVQNTSGRLLLTSHISNTTKTKTGYTFYMVYTCYKMLSEAYFGWWQLL